LDEEIASVVSKQYNPMDMKLPESKSFFNSGATQTSMPAITHRESTMVDKMIAGRN